MKNNIGILKYYFQLTSMNTDSRFYSYKAQAKHSTSAWLKS